MLKAKFIRLERDGSTIMCLDISEELANCTRLILGMCLFISLINLVFKKKWHLLTLERHNIITLVLKLTGKTV